MLNIHSLEHHFEGLFLFARDSSLFWKRGTEASLGGRYDPDASRYARIID